MSEALNVIQQPSTIQLDRNSHSADPFRHQTEFPKLLEFPNVHNFILIIKINLCNARQQHKQRYQDSAANYSPIKCLTRGIREDKLTGAEAKCEKVFGFTAKSIFNLRVCAARSRGWEDDKSVFQQHVLQVKVIERENLSWFDSRILDEKLKLPEDGW